MMTDYLAGELSPRRRKAFEKHLAECEKCRENLDDFKAFWKQSGEIFTQPEIKLELAPERKAEIHAVSQSPRRSFLDISLPGYWLELAASFIIVVILAGMMLPALNQARGKARAIAEASRLKQLKLEEEQKAMDEEDAGSFSVAPAGKPRPSVDQYRGRKAQLAVSEVRSNIQLAGKAVLPPTQQSFKAMSCAAPAGTVKAKAIDKDTFGDKKVDVCKEVATEQQYPVVNLTLGKFDSEKREKVVLREKKAVKGYATQSVSRYEYQKAPKRILKKRILLEKTTFTLNLKLWNLTTPKTFRKFLKFKKCPTPTRVHINKNTGKITIWGSQATVAKIKEVMEKLQEEEKRLKDLRGGLPFIKTMTRPISTFSIDTDTASYIQARRAILRGLRPNPENVRAEDFINYFDYHYKSPVRDTFAVYPEAAPAPFRTGNYLLRIGVQGKRLGPSETSVTNYTILLDGSGSMASGNRAELAFDFLKMLVLKLKPNDRISMIVCGETPQTLFADQSGSRKAYLKKAVSSVIFHDTANFRDGMVAAYRNALRNYTPGAINKVVVISDGILNIPEKQRSQLISEIDKARRKGVSNLVIGLGGDGDDQLLESIAATGDGSYIFIDNQQDVIDLFGKHFEARFREIAKDVKIQVEFNPETVNAYRQVGYKNRQLSRADFRNDKVDAGEVGSGQSVTALYELKLTPGIAKDKTVCIVRMRYKLPQTMEVKEHSYSLTASQIRKSFENTEPAFKLAAFAAEFAEMLRYPETQGIATASGIRQLLDPLYYEHYRNDGQVAELIRLLKLTK
jgi:Ca-activated chloride channel family protein